MRTPFCFFLLALAAAGCHTVPAPVPATDIHVPKLSRHGAYEARVASTVQPIPIGAIHSWTLHLASPSGEPVPGASVEVTGEMPQHHHGLPTHPRAVASSVPGEYRVDGVKFSMNGWWRLQLVVSATAGVDTVQFDLALDEASGARTPTRLTTQRWDAAERATLFSLSLSTLPPVRPDPTNRVADDPRAVRLGRALFFDSSFSANGRVACATCHNPALDFQDTLPRGRGVGIAARRTMPLAGTAYSPWNFWDGRATSQWEQALGPIENAAEHGGTRARVAHVLATKYATEYAEVFGRIPSLSGVPVNAGPVSDPAARAAWNALAQKQQASVSRMYANAGKAIAAFERTLSPEPNRVDRWIDAQRTGDRGPDALLLTRDEVEGAHIFVGRAKCATCHRGPRLTDDAFHNIGVADARSSAPDSGRAAGVRQAISSEFACTSRYSDAPDKCAELRFADTSSASLLGAFKTPSLRGAVAHAPYMHAGQLATLEKVISHYYRPPRAVVGKSELTSLPLSRKERKQLAAFVRAIGEAPPA